MLKLNGIEKKFPGFSLKNICLEVNKGDYFVILGKSGAGKSLLLEIIAGVTKQDAGKIFFGDEDISCKKIQDRKFVLVYQNLALFPHLNVYNNIAFSLKCNNVQSNTFNNRILEVAQTLSITDLLGRSIEALSGGEAQRVALARALVIKPDILLLDEPLASIDVEMKTELQKLLKKINNSGQTIIHVTHNFDEALALSNRIAVIDKGTILQMGETDDVFQNPQNSFIANLSGVKNFIKAKLIDIPEDSSLKIAVPEKSNIEIKILTDICSGNGFLAFNAKDVFLSENPTETTAVNNFLGVITDINKTQLGYEISVDIGIPVIISVSRLSFQKLGLCLDKKVWASFKASAPYFIPLTNESTLTY
ncbi:MAG: ATP-binding cassette domain-containing protein [Bacteroidales bacterium]|nr:ATP-binding cassette domain-containing protein [Bacteroidales bacterium]